jgi:flagellar hook-length control protein FliK
MNALSMTLPPASANLATPAPTQGAPARDGAQAGFAQCLDQAVERDPVATDAAAKPAAPTDAGDPAAATPDTMDAARPATGPRGTRRTPDAAPHLRQAAATLPAAAALTAPCETTLAQAIAATDAGPEDLATAAKKDGATELADLLPGWAPALPAAPVASAASAASAAAPLASSAPRQGADAADATITASALPPQTASTADAHASMKAARPDESAAPASFTLPQALHAAQASTPPTQDTPPVAQGHVAAPLDSPAFAPALASQVRWLVRDGLQHAQLSLNPAEMGPVTVQIVLDGREARIDFRADLALTRQAIEASLPVLAAALDDSGLRLAGGGVHDGQASRQGMGQGAGQPGWQGSAQGTRFGAGAGDAAAAGTPRAAVPTRGLVDLIA